MIRSSTAPDAHWKPVPDGFHVAWRNVDLTVFKHRSRVAAGLDAVRQTITGAADAVHVGCAVVRWRAIDRLRRGRSRMRRRSAYAVAVTRRVIRLGPPKPPRPSWNVTVHITVGQQPRFEPQSLAA